MQQTWETRVRSLGQEDPLEEGMATHSGILAWRIPRTEEPRRATVHGVAKSRTRLSTPRIGAKLDGRNNPIRSRAKDGSKQAGCVRSARPAATPNPTLWQSQRTPPHCSHFIQTILSPAIRPGRMGVPPSPALTESLLFFLRL